MFKVEAGSWALEVGMGTPGEEWRDGEVGFEASADVETVPFFFFEYHVDLVDVGWLWWWWRLGCGCIIGG